MGQAHSLEDFQGSHTQEDPAIQAIRFQDTQCQEDIHTQGDTTQEDRDTQDIRKDIIIRCMDILCMAADKDRADESFKKCMGIKHSGAFFLDKFSTIRTGGIGVQK